MAPRRRTAPKKQKTPDKKPGEAIRIIGIRGTIITAVIVLVIAGATWLYQERMPNVAKPAGTSLLSSVIDFSDLAPEEKQNAEFMYALKFLTAKKIIKGYDDNTFQSKKPVNRAEFLKMLAVSRGADTANFNQKCFKDITAEDWFTPYLCYGKNAGWTTGYKDGTVKPGKEITLAEAVKIAVVAMEWDLDAAKDQPLPKKLSPKEWYAPYFRVAIMKNITDGASADINKVMTRFDTVLLLFKAMLVEQMKTPSYDNASISDLFKANGIAMSDEASPSSGEAKPVSGEPKGKKPVTKPAKK